MHRPQRHPRVANLILGALPTPQMHRIQQLLEPVELTRGELIGRPNQRVVHMYFVDRGLVSLVKTMRDGRVMEVGTIGIEGVTDVHAVFGTDDRFLEAVVQIPGVALRIRTNALKSAMRESQALRELMQGYLRLSLRQCAQLAACNCLHPVNARCCRWLLFAHDSALSDTFPLTHESLAMMLGVRRGGVTVALKSLTNARLIRQDYGVVTVVDRGGLERAACDCHAAIQAELQRPLE